MRKNYKPLIEKLTLLVLMSLAINWNGYAQCFHNTSSGTTLIGNYSWGQSFTANCSGELTSVKLGFRGGSMPIEKLVLYPGEIDPSIIPFPFGSFPGALVVQSPGSFVGSYQDELTIDMDLSSNNISAEAGDKFTIIVYVTAQGYSNIPIQRGQSISDGLYYFYNTSNGTWATTTLYDTHFSYDIEIGPTAPTVVNPISDQTLHEGFTTSTINLSGVFEDLNEDALTYSATSSNESAATVAVSESTLTITEVGNGNSTITVTANDNVTGSVDDSFDLLVNGVPVAVGSLNTVIEAIGFSSSTLDLSGIFSDPEADDFTLSASSGDESVVTVGVSGTTLTFTEVDKGTATITVTALDSKGGSGEETFSFYLASEPVFTSPASASFNENLTGIVLDIDAKDGVDADPDLGITYSIIGGADQGFFQINSETGVCTITSQLDFENPTDAGSDNTLEVTVQATNGLISADQTITISIKNLDEFTASSGTPDWNDPSSWESGEVPGSNDDVSLPPNITITVDDIQAVKNLLVQVNTVLEITDGGALAIFGEYSGEGEVEQTREITGTASGGYSIVGSSMTETPDVSTLPVVVFEYDGTDGFKRKKTGALEPGRGYFLRESNPDGISLALALGGEPNTGDVSVDISTAGDGFNLLANPYTAAISVVDFIDANDDIEGTLYLWDDGGENSGGTRGGDYIAVNKMGLAGVINNGGYSGNTGSGSFDMNIGSVQGFFAKALNDGEVVFSQSMQVTTSASNAVFFRVANTPDEEIPQTVKLKLSNGELSNMLLLGLASGASVDKDRGYDSEKFAGNSEISFYSKRDEYKYAIEGLGRIEEGEEAMFNLSYDLSIAGQYELTLEEEMNLPAEMDIILYDKVEDKEYNLRDARRVTFATSEGQEVERFTLTFRLNARALNTTTAPHLSLYGSSNKLNILYPSNKDEQVRIVTLDGKEVVKEVVHFNNGKTTMDVQLKPKQLYVLIIQNQSIKFIITE